LQPNQQENKSSIFALAINSAKVLYKTRSGRMQTIRLYQQGELLDFFVDLDAVEAELRYQELCEERAQENGPPSDEALVIHVLQIDERDHVSLQLPSDDQHSNHKGARARQKELDLRNPEIESMLSQALKAYTGSRSA